MIRIVIAASLLLSCSGGELDGMKHDTVDTATYSQSREAVTNGGSWHVGYVPTPDPIPATDNFGLSLTVAAVAGGDAVAGAQVGVVASMPAHNHFMNTTPVVTDNGDGTYWVDGMQFHMSGHWRMDVTVEVEGVSETAIFHTECCE
jgi:hypothetical protein